VLQYLICQAWIEYYPNKFIVPYFQLGLWEVLGLIVGWSESEVWGLEAIEPLGYVGKFSQDLYF
jgi:hypothetical protein